MSQISAARAPNQIIRATSKPEREREKSTVSTKADITETEVRTESSLVQKLRQISDLIPLDVPEATEENALAHLADPAALDNSEIASEDLWEELLNPVLKAALGWGVETSLDAVVRRGRFGFPGLVKFVEYFTETRGVDVALFEGKLSHLIECAMKMMLVSRKLHYESY